MSETTIKSPLASDDLKVMLSTLGDRLTGNNELYAKKLGPLMLPEPSAAVPQTTASDPLPIFPPLFDEMRNMIIRIAEQVSKLEIQLNRTSI